MTHDVAGNNIVNHALHIARETQETIHVTCDDTDVFVLLVHFFFFLHLKVSTVIL